MANIKSCTVLLKHMAFKEEIYLTVATWFLGIKTENFLPEHKAN